MALANIPAWRFPFLLAARLAARLATILVGTLLLTACDSSKRDDFSETLVAYSVNDLSARTCDFKTYASQRIKTNCYWLKLGSNTSFKLPIVVFSKTDFNTENLLLNIAGGPGVGGLTNSNNTQDWLDWYQNSDITADLLVYSARGTPGSKPHWYCQEYEQESFGAVSQNITLEDESRQAYSILQDCMQDYAQWLQASLHVKEPPISALSSRNQAQDLLRLVATVKYNNVYLWGESFGTRVALLAGDYSAVQSSPIAQAAKTKIRSLILDSPYPPGEGGADAWLAMLDKAMAIHSKRYSMFKGGQNQKFSQLWQRALGQVISADAITEIKETPLFFKVDSWYHDEYPEQGLELLPIYKHSKVGFWLNSQRLVSLLFYSLYETNTSNTFYLSLEELANNNISNNVDPYLNTRHLIELFVNDAFDPSFSSLVFFATECTDNNRLTSKNAGLSELNAFWRTYTQAIREYDICNAPIFDDIPPLAANVDVDMPVLVLAGEQDHVTPVEWAKALIERASAYRKTGGESNGPWQLIVAPTTHGVINTGGCSKNLIQDWINLDKNNKDGTRIWLTPEIVSAHCKEARLL